MKQYGFTLEGKHALVCGGSAGIGEASARVMASMGAKITVLARRKDRLTGLLPALENEGAARALALVADLDDRDGLERLLSEHLAQHGPVHIWINNTGGPAPGRLVDADEQDFEKALGRHLFASQRILKLVLPGMEAEGYGRIINVLSTSVRQPIPGLGVSNTIRGAMASWAKTLANELPAGITINSILPGFTMTERLASLAQSRAESAGIGVNDVEDAWVKSIPEGRLGKAEELGATIAFLASPAASYIRGVCLPVDGGRISCI
ncbi:MAG: SDR family oxidoreductase [Myxococcales bacterium]|nr:SDR family oxidoreductase [Myxococcales bacterium]MCB9643202.1 SDR family oxidoreductase [Myxococcales bacterium]